MFYSAYLAEEIMGSGFSIAPGCSGTDRPGGRCSFSEFMNYIWAEFKEKGDTTRPTGKLLDPKTEERFATVKLATLLQKINGFKKAGLTKPITGNVDKERLFPGSSDYYDAMKKAGGRMQDFRTFHDGMKDDDPKKELGKNLIGRGKEAGGMVVDIRAKEMDNNDIKPRLKDLETRLGFKLETKPGRDSTGKVGAYQVWDAVASIAKNPDKEADIRKAWGDWFKDPADNKRFVNRHLISVKVMLILRSNLRHIKAFVSAKMAASSCGC
jgi:hypothetical protein